MSYLLYKLRKKCPLTRIAASDTTLQHRSVSDPDGRSHVIIPRRILRKRSAIKLLMGFIRIDILERNIARLAVIRGLFQLSFRFFLDVWSGCGGGFFLWFLSGVYQARMAYDVASVGRGVGAGAAAVHAISRRRARGGGLPAVVFHHACDVGFLLETKGWGVSC